MLRIENLHAETAGKPILTGLSLEVNAGEVHAIMGPNGAGKSTLAYVLAGRPGYEITAGSLNFLNFDLAEMAPHARAAAGLFLGFQYPVEIPGVSTVHFLREALNAQRKERGEPPLSGADFLKRARAQAAALGLDADMLKRPVNVGFSGGEKKRAEMVQMGILDPKLAILDETDSGLDIDALKAVGAGINTIMRQKAGGPDKAVLLITHYQRLLDYVRPDFVHVLAGAASSARAGRSWRTNSSAKAMRRWRREFLLHPPRVFSGRGTVAAGDGGGENPDGQAFPLHHPSDDPPPQLCRGGAVTPAISTRDEAWRWADPAAIERAAAAPYRAANLDDALFLDLTGPRLLFVDGVLQRERSAPGGVAIEAIAIATDHPLGRQAQGTGWRLTLGAGHAAETVQIVHVATGGKNHLPAEIVLAEDSAASIVETFAGSGWSNRLTRIALGRASRLMRAVRIAQGEGFVSLRDEAVLAQGASLATTVLAMGGMGCRIDAAVVLEGAQAFAEYGGALLGRAEQHQEAAIVVRHAAPDGASRQLWRIVAEDRAIGSAAARVEVARDAQKTDAVQSLRGLLLQRTATVNLKPELEIFADDVKCAHGATVGELDKQALFYLESRGLPPAQARALLTRSFVGDAIARIGAEAVRDAFAEAADAWLEGGA